MIPNLVPIETYSVDETGYWKRLPLVYGVMMMVMGTAITWFTIGDSLQPVEVLERGIAGGAGCGILFTFLLRRWEALHRERHRSVDTGRKRRGMSSRVFASNRTVSCSTRDALFRT